MPNSKRYRELVPRESVVLLRNLIRDSLKDSRLLVPDSIYPQTATRFNYSIAKLQLAVLLGQLADNGLDRTSIPNLIALIHILSNEDLALVLDWNPGEDDI